MRPGEHPPFAVDDDGGRMHDHAVGVGEQRREEQHLPRISDGERTASAGPQARGQEYGAGAPVAIDGESVTGALRQETDERPAARGLDDVPAEIGIEGDDTVGGDAALEGRDGELERRIAADVNEGTIEAADDARARSLGVGDGDGASADAEAGDGAQVLARVLQPVGQTKLPMVFLVLIVLVVLFLHTWSATSLSTMSTRSIVGRV